MLLRWGRDRDGAMIWGTELYRDFTAWVKRRTRCFDLDRFYFFSVFPVLPVVNLRTLTGIPKSAGYAVRS